MLGSQHDSTRVREAADSWAAFGVAKPRIRQACPWTGSSLAPGHWVTTKWSAFNHSLLEDCPAYTLSPLNAGVVHKALCIYSPPVFR